MEFQDGTFKSILVTTGRKSGREHSVQLRTVSYNGRFYFSRKDPNSDWLKNALVTPNVKIQYQERLVSGIASLVGDKELCKKISQMKYQDKRSEEARIVLQVNPCE
jgi:hypothetical protein